MATPILSKFNRKTSKNQGNQNLMLTNTKSLLRFVSLSLHTTGLKAVYSCVLPLGIPKGCNQYAVVSGFFICALTSVLHTIVVSLHGLLGRKHRHQETPPVCRPALIWRLVKHTVHRW